MITLSEIIERFGAEFIDRYQDTILPSQLKALSVMRHCRSTQSPVISLKCNNCEKQRFLPHSCGGVMKIIRTRIPKKVMLLYLPVRPKETEAFPVR